MPEVDHHPAASAPALSVARDVFHLSKRLLSRATFYHLASDTISADLLKREQETIAIPTIYGGLDSGPSPGTVVGATLGAVAGFLLLVWLFSTLSIRRRGVIVDEEIVREREPRRRSRRSEMRSVSRTPRPERVIRTERIVRDTSRAPPVAMARAEFIIDERSERRVEGDDVVEVIEEVSSVGPPRKKSSRRSGSYRSVAPGLYAGGDFPSRSIY